MNYLIQVSTSYSTKHYQKYEEKNSILVKNWFTGQAETFWVAETFQNEVRLIAGESGVDWYIRRVGTIELANKRRKYIFVQKRIILLIQTFLDFLFGIYENFNVCFLP